MRRRNCRPFCERRQSPRSNIRVEIKHGAVGITTIPDTNIHLLATTWRSLRLVRCVSKNVTGWCVTLCDERVFTITRLIHALPLHLVSYYALMTTHNEYDTSVAHSRLCCVVRSFARASVRLTSNWRTPTLSSLVDVELCHPEILLRSTPSDHNHSWRPRWRRCRLKLSRNHALFVFCVVAVHADVPSAVFIMLIELITVIGQQLVLVVWSGPCPSKWLIAL